MSVRAWPLCAAGLLLAACVSSPKETVLNLDTTDRKWTSKQCVAARKAVARYDDKAGTRSWIGLIGNFVAPYAGTATSLAMSAAQDDERKRLNDQVRRSCISDPLQAKSARERRG
ncbi:MAG TPA: hypothetical protein VD929_11485 [Caulobacteraceae bacterium]|nr:hypothetical protein [Caulobacteraceae bacterium]